MAFTLHENISRKKKWSCAYGRQARNRQNQFNWFTLLCDNDASKMKEKIGSAYFITIWSSYFCMNQQNKHGNTNNSNDNNLHLMRSKSPDRIIHKKYPTNKYIQVQERVEEKHTNLKQIKYQIDAIRFWNLKWNICLSHKPTPMS